MVSFRSQNTSRQHPAMWGRTRSLNMQAKTSGRRTAQSPRASRARTRSRTACSRASALTELERVHLAAPSTLNRAVVSAALCCSLASCVIRMLAARLALRMAAGKGPLVLRRPRAEGSGAAGADGNAGARASALWPVWRREALLCHGVGRESRIGICECCRRALPPSPCVHWKPG